MAASLEAFLSAFAARVNTRGGERKDQTVNDGYKLVAGPLTILLTAVVFLFFYLRNRKKGWTAIYYTVAVFALWSVYTVMVHTILPLPLDWHKRKIPNGKMCSCNMLGGGP